MTAARLDIPLVTTAGLLSLTAMMEMGIVNIAIPSIAAEFGVGPATAQWVVLAYQLPLMALLVPAGLWLDARPLRPTLFGALAVFAASGAAAALTPASAAGLGWLIAVRAGQGMSAAVLFVLMPVLAARSAPPEMRARAMSVTATLGPLGAVLGPPISGLVVDHSGWRAVFLVKIPLIVAAAVLARRSLGRGGPEPGPARPPGARAGLLDTLRSARAGPLRALLLATLGMAAAMQAMQFTLSYRLQDAGWSAAAAGSILLIFALVMATTGVGAGWVADTWGPAPTAIGGSGLVVAGLVVVAALGPAPGTLALAITLAGVGLGMGLYGGPTQSWVMGVAEPRHVAATASMMQLARTAGFAAGPLLAGSLLGITGAAVWGLVAAAGAAAVAFAAFIAARRRGEKIRAPGNSPPSRDD